MNKWETIVDIPLCEPCIMGSRKCALITLMERGFLPGTKIKVLQELNGNKIVKIKDGGEWAIENRLYNQIKTK